jgi:hypothetical protein
MQSQYCWRFETTPAFYQHLGGSLECQQQLQVSFFHRREILANIALRLTFGVERALDIDWMYNADSLKDYPLS